MGWVLFFDGECGFCSRSVRRVHGLDRAGVVDFAPLQGELAAERGFTRYAAKGGGTMVLLREEDGRIFLKSEACVMLGRVLGGVWRVMAEVCGVLPRGVRDAIYDGVARNRHLLGGGGGSCEVPEGSLRERMRG